MSFKEIVFEVRDNVATIVLNRPEVLNVLSMNAMRELAECLMSCEESNEVSVVVLRGAGGRAFCAGADINVFTSFKDSADARRFWTITGPKIHRLIEKMTKPVLAVITGYCLGGGLEVMLACDLSIATEDSKFGFPEVNLGLIPGWGGTQRIARMVSRQKAKELVMLAEIIDATEARRIGLINWVVPNEKLEDTVKQLVSTLKQKSRVAISCAKDAVNIAYEVGLDQGLMHEANLDTLLINTEDTANRIKAFLTRKRNQ